MVGLPVPIKADEENKVIYTHEIQSNEWTTFDTIKYWRYASLSSVDISEILGADEVCAIIAVATTATERYIIGTLQFSPKAMIAQYGSISEIIPLFPSIGFIGSNAFIKNLVGKYEGYIQLYPNTPNVAFAVLINNDISYDYPIEFTLIKVR